MSDDHPMTAPAEQESETPTHWMIFFEDQDQRPEIFTDEAAARKRYADCLLNWSCHLFVQASALTARERDALDAKRYRWLRDTLQNSVGGGVEVNDQKLVYEEPVPGEQVRVFWYPDTPVGFYQVHGETLDAAIDAALTPSTGGS